MSNKTYSEKLLDPRWQKKRLEIMEREGFSCAFCADKTKTLHIHHYCYSKGKEPWEYDNRDLVCICASCHEFIHMKNVPEWIRELIMVLTINPEVNGNAIRMIYLSVHDEFNK